MENSNRFRQLHVRGNILAIGTITPNSDWTIKTDFVPVDAAAVLDRVTRLPIQQWRFKTESDEVKHFGPMVQDFRSAFGLGQIPTPIATSHLGRRSTVALPGRTPLELTALLIRSKARLSL